MPTEFVSISRRVVRWPGNVAPLAGGGLIKDGDQFAALRVDKALVCRNPAWPRAASCHRFVAPALEHETEQQNKAGDSQTQDYAKTATGDR
jgi:hypothetical protein